MNRRRFLALLAGTALVPFVPAAAKAERTLARRHVASFRGLPIFIIDDLPKCEGMVQELCVFHIYPRSDDVFMPRQFTGFTPNYGGFKS